MGTSACICVKKDDNTYEGIYVGFDGYLEHTGRILKNFYNTYEKACELVSFGDASFIMESLDLCVFYHRDKNEDFEDVKSYITDSYLDIEAVFEYISFYYCFIDNEWKVKDCKGNLISF